MRQPLSQLGAGGTMLQPIGHRKPHICPQARASFEYREADDTSDAERPARGAHASTSYCEQDEASLAQWQQLHPCVLTQFDRFAAAVAGKRLAVFLDYDGTLTPIVKNPEEAFMSEATRAIVRELAQLYPTAIISGRGREKVEEFVQLRELYYAGSHGMDIAGPHSGAVCAPADGSAASAAAAPAVESNAAHAGAADAGDAVAPEAPPAPATAYPDSAHAHGREHGHAHAHAPHGSHHAHPPLSKRFSFQAAERFRPAVDAAWRQLTESLAPIPGATVEHNVFCVSAHFRNCAPDDWPAVTEAVNDVVASRPELRVTRGRKVLEVRPKVDWDKGRALLEVLAALGLRSQADVVAVYIGDDQTDEDAFRVLNDHGLGYGILVSSKMKATEAAYTVKDPAEVARFLSRLVHLGQGPANGWRAAAACNGWRGAYYSGGEGQGQGAQAQQAQQAQQQQQQQGHGGEPTEPQQ